MTMTEEQARGMAGQDAKVSPKPAIPRDLDDQQKLCQELFERVNILDEKLTPVLREEINESIPTSEKSIDPVGVAGKIRDHNDLIKNSLVRLGSIIDRLEI